MATNGSFSGMPEPPPTTLAPARLPTLTQALCLYGLMLALFIAQGVVLALRSPDHGVQASTDIPTLLLTQLLFLILPALLWTRLFRWDVRRTFRVRGVPGRIVFYTVVASLAFIPLSQEVEALVVRAIPVPPAIEEAFKRLLTAHGPRELTLALFAVAVVPGVIEEALFRGIFLSALLRNFNPRVAIFWSALFFAIMHFNPWQFAGGLVLGSIYGAIALWTGSLAPTMLAHMLNNGLYVILVNVLPQATEPASGLPARVLLDVAGAVLSVLCLVRIRQLGAATRAREAALPGGVVA